MTNASHAPSPYAPLPHAPLSAPLRPTLIRRRAARRLRLAPPSAYAAPLPAIAPVAPAPDWRGDLRVFVGCYVAGLVFFLIMLS